MHHGHSSRVAFTTNQVLQWFGEKTWRYKCIWSLVNIRKNRDIYVLLDSWPSSGTSSLTNCIIFRNIQILRIFQIFRDFPIFIILRFSLRFLKGVLGESKTPYIYWKIMRKIEKIQREPITFLCFAHFRLLFNENISWAPFCLKISTGPSLSFFGPVKKCYQIIEFWGRNYL